MQLSQSDLKNPWHFKSSLHYISIYITSSVKLPPVAVVDATTSIGIFVKVITKSHISANLTPKTVVCQH